MAQAASFEQRRFPRVPLQYPVKVTAGSLGLRYLAGQTCNVSAGGTYVELTEPGGPLPIGTPVSIAMPHSPHDVVLKADQSLTGRIVRTGGSPKGLGIRFDAPVTIALPAA